MKDDLALVASAIHYIEDHLKDKLSLDDIAGHVGFSKYYFTRLFTKYTGQSPYDYFRGRKLTAAIMYMQASGTKIIDAAYEFGFSSPEVFARACAAVFGKPPTAIRKAIMNGTFSGIAQISEGYLWFMNAYDGEPELIMGDALDLRGVGYFTESFSDPLHLMTIEKLRGLGYKNDRHLMKVTWLDRQVMGYMNFVGYLERESTEENPLLLSKSLPKLAYLVFDYKMAEDELEYFNSYIYDRYIPEKGYEAIMPIQLEIMTGNRNSKLYIPVVPVV